MSETQANYAERNWSISPPWMWFVYRCMVILGGSIIGICGLFFGYKLVMHGAMGDFAISGETKSLKGFITSVSPGVAFAFIGCIVTIVSYWIQKFNWGPTSPEILKVSKKN